MTFPFPHMASAASFSPLDLPNLNRWYDPSSSPLIQSGGDVSQMDDKSGNAYHVAQGVATNQPSLGTINGRQALVHDGVDEFMFSQTGMDDIDGTDQPYTLFVVCQPASLAANQQLIAFNRSSSVGYHSILLGTSGPVWVCQKRDDASVFVGPTGGVPTTSPTLLTVVHTGIAVTLRVNGAVVINAASQNVGITTLNRYTIGGWYQVTTLADPFNGMIGENLLCSSELSAGDISAVEAYLAPKWGISL